MNPANRLILSALLIWPLIHAPAHADSIVDRIESAMQGLRQAEADSLALFHLGEVERESGTESAPYADALALLAKVRMYANRITEPETEEYARTALEINERIYGTESSEIVPALTRLGKLFELNNDYGTAMQHFERARAILEDDPGGNDRDYTSVLYRMARVRRQEGDYPASRALFEQCITAIEATGGEDDSRLAQVLWSYSILLRRMGDWSASEQALLRALHMRREKYGPDHPKVADLETSLAHTYRKLARYGEARALYVHAIQALEAAIGPDHAELVAALTGYANLLFEMKSYDDAALAYERIDRILRTAENPNRADIAMTQHNIGNVHLEAGHYDLARQYLEEALQLFRELYGDEHEDVVTTIHSLAIVCHNLGEHESAEARLREAVDLATRNLGLDHPITIRCKDDLGREFLAQRRLAEAEAIFRETKAAREEIYGNEHPVVLASRAGLALTLGARKDTAHALAQALDASETRRRLIRLNAQAQAEREALNFASGLDGAPGIAVSLLSPTSAESLVVEVWDEVIRCRALVLDEVAAQRREFARERGDATVALRDTLRVAARALSEAALRGPGRGEDIALYRESIRKARARKEIAERALAGMATGSASGEFRSIDAGFDETVARVDADIAVVSYVLHLRPDFEHEGAGGARTDTAYTVFVRPPRNEGERVAQSGGGRGPVGAVRSVTALPIGSRAEVDQAIMSWRHALITGDEESCREWSETLRAMLWDPVAAHCRTASSIFLIPDGAINLVDFHALRMSDGSFWVETNPLLHLLAAERDLVIDETVEPGCGLLVMGGADYEAAADLETDTDTTRTGAFSNARSIAALRGGCGSFNSIHFDPLPAALREADEVASVWRAGGGAVVMKAGRRASETTFKNEAPGKRAIHLATHAFFVSDDCSAREGTRGIGGAVWAGEDVPDLGPLLRSGVALAGANRRVESAEGAEDGVLTAEEIALIDLSGVQTAILSACGTGLGEVWVGEGVLGLRRAFRTAGVASLLISLWDVGDEMSSLWMRTFYEQFTVVGSDLHTAARAAAMELLESQRSQGQSDHPTHWAGFVATGTGRRSAIPQEPCPRSFDSESRVKN